MVNKNFQSRIFETPQLNKRAECHSYLYLFYFLNTLKCDMYENVKMFI